MLKITDLNTPKELDREAMKQLRGGMFWSVMMYSLYGGSYQTGGGGSRGLKMS